MNIPVAKGPRPWEHACPHCNQPISAQQRIRPGHCGKPACDRAHLLKTIETRKKKFADEYTAMLRAVDTVGRDRVEQLAEEEDVSVDAITVCVVPYQNKPVVALPEDRRARFLAHLEAILTEAFTVAVSDILEDPQFDKDDAPETPVMAAGCATCQGRCCEEGAGNNAFLTATTFNTLRSRAPELTRDDIREIYVSALPEASAKGGCVYQGPVGCVLERRQRAQICNSYHCGGLKKLSQMFLENPEAPIAIAAFGEIGLSAIAGYSNDRGWRVLRGTEGSPCDGNAEDL